MLLQHQCPLHVQLGKILHAKRRLASPADLFAEQRLQVFLQGSGRELRMFGDRGRQAVQSPRRRTGALEGGDEGQEGGVQLAGKRTRVPDHLSDAPSCEAQAYQ